MTAMRTGLTRVRFSDMATSFLWLLWKGASKTGLGLGVTVGQFLWSPRTRELM